MAALNPYAPDFIPLSHHTVLNQLPILPTPPPLLQPPPPPPYYYYCYNPPLTSTHHCRYNSTPTSSYYQNPNYVSATGSEWQRMMINPPFFPYSSSPTTANSLSSTIDHHQQQQQEVVEKEVVLEEVKSVKMIPTTTHRAGKAPFGMIKRVRGHHPRLPHPLSMLYSHGKQIWKPKSNFGGGAAAASGGGGAAAANGGGGGGLPFPTKRPVGGHASIEQNSPKTSLMIKNIPNKYTREMLVKFLDEHCKAENAESEEEGKAAGSSSAFDFLYLPIDFKHILNKGYAFVNFTNPKGVWKLYKYLEGYKWVVLKSNKICELTYARIQGKEALVKHFKDSKFECDTEEFLPVYFDPARDGSNGELVKQSTAGRCVGFSTLR